MRLTESMTFGEMVDALDEGDQHARFVLGVIVGRLGFHYTVAVAYFHIDRLGWYGHKLWEVYEGECGQDIDKFIETFNLRRWAIDPNNPNRIPG